MSSLEMQVQKEPFGEHESYCLVASLDNDTAGIIGIHSVAAGGDRWYTRGR